MLTIYSSLTVCGQSLEEENFKKLNNYAWLLSNIWSIKSVVQYVLSKKQPANYTDTTADNIDLTVTGACPILCPIIVEISISAEPEFWVNGIFGIVICLWV